MMIMIRKYKARHLGSNSVTQPCWGLRRPHCWGFKIVRIFCTPIMGQYIQLAPSHCITLHQHISSFWDLIFKLTPYKSPSWEANSHSASQKFPASYGTNRPLLDPTLIQTNWVHNFPPNFSKFILILDSTLPSTPTSSDWCFPFRFTDQNCVYILHPSHACYMSRPSHPPWFHDPNNIWLSVQVIKLLMMQYS